MSTSAEKSSSTGTPERHGPRYEFRLTWEELVIATLERKVAYPDDPTADRGDYFCRRYFRVPTGETVRATGTLAGAVHPTEGDYSDETWSLVITSPATDGNPVAKPYQLFIQADEHDHYRVTQGDSDIPLGPESVEALFVTVATMSPIGPTEFITSKTTAQ